MFFRALKLSSIEGGGGIMVSNLDSLAASFSTMSRTHNCLDNSLHTQTEPEKFKQLFKQQEEYHDKYTCKHTYINSITIPKNLFFLVILYDFFIF